MSLRDTQFTVVLGSVSSEQIESLTARPWYTWLRSLAGNGDDIAPAAIGFTATTIATWQRLNGDGRVIVLADADAGECVERFLAAVGRRTSLPTDERGGYLMDSDTDEARLSEIGQREVFYLVSK